MKYNLLIVIVLNLFLSNIFGQENGEKKEKEGKHLFTGAFGYSFIPNGSSKDAVEAEGVFVPTVGVDYFYSVTNKWEIGIMTDIELGDYLIFDKELERENAFIIAVMGVYSITNNIGLLVGGGVELEKNRNLGIIRLGGEYAFKFDNGWILAPGVFYDIKEGFDSWSLLLSFGKEF